MSFINVVNVSKYFIRLFKSPVCLILVKIVKRYKEVVCRIVCPTWKTKYPSIPLFLLVKKLFDETGVLEYTIILSHNQNITLS